MHRAVVRARFSPRFQQLPAGEFLFQFALQFG